MYGIPPGAPLPPNWTAPLNSEEQEAGIAVGQGGTVFVNPEPEYSMNSESDCNSADEQAEEEEMDFQL